MVMEANVNPCPFSLFVRQTGLSSLSLECKIPLISSYNFSVHFLIASSKSAYSKNSFNTLSASFPNWFDVFSFHANIISSISFFNSLLCYNPSSYPLPEKVAAFSSLVVCCPKQPIVRRSPKRIISCFIQLLSLLLPTLLDAVYPAKYPLYSMVCIGFHYFPRFPPRLFKDRNLLFEHSIFVDFKVFISVEKRMEGASFFPLFYGRVQGPTNN
jgi:hypothetical protein